MVFYGEFSFSCPKLGDNVYLNLFCSLVIFFLDKCCLELRMQSKCSMWKVKMESLSIVCITFCLLLCFPSSPNFSREQWISPCLHFLTSHLFGSLHCDFQNSTLPFKDRQDQIPKQGDGGRHWWLRGHCRHRGTKEMSLREMAQVLGRQSSEP